jgi:hypothetical protein
VKRARGKGRTKAKGSSAKRDRGKKTQRPAEKPKDETHWAEPLVEGAVEFAVRAAVKIVTD